LLYPSYRLDVRIPFEEMSLGWAVGSFELKEHAGGVALGMLPAYAFLWFRADDVALQRARTVVTSPARHRRLVRFFGRSRAQ
jgi:hypothetical protein